ncbi:hypothetical protein LQZ18_16560 [Lachnospiraceae bacterium ZAX-1]
MEIERIIDTPPRLQLLLWLGGVSNMWNFLLHGVVCLNERNMYMINTILHNFKTPPLGYGEVPFYWWVGDPLTKERLSWQMEKLAGKKISGLQINYAHTDEGGHSWGLSYESDPPIFTEEWWELVGWFMEQCKKNGFSVSLSDYTLCSPGQGHHTDEIIRDNPGICGKNLTYEQIELAKGECFELGGNIVAANCLFKDNTDLLELELGQKFIAEKDCEIAVVRAETVEYSIDPMDVRSGQEVIRTYFQRFEDHFVGEGGKGLNFFFSDELNFGISGDLWNKQFEKEFFNYKGYDIKQYLPGLFIDIGDITPKIRLDYRDVVIRLEEKNYFSPVYEWHEERGMTYGCDHGGRGKDVVDFGDYFRTQKYNQGPGCDQPGLECDLIKNKVASSIAHLYKRPRTWLEGFYGSGWGTTTEQVTDAIFRNFATGHNLLSLHGLYYTTKGGFWEWAPPCNHFRMPYWACIDPLLDCNERLSYLLSQGVHVCDVAIVYPTAAMEADRQIGQKSVDTAFELGEFLYQKAVDFDFIDFESIDRAEISNNHLCVSGEKYKVIVIPSMRAVRFSMIEKLELFKRQGGIVIILGELPVESDRAGRNDQKLNQIVEELKEYHVNRNEALLDLLKEKIEFDFICTDGQQPFFMHRKIEDNDLFVVYNCSKDTICSFRAQGKPVLMNPWNGELKNILGAEEKNGYVTCKLPLEEKELHLIMFSNDIEEMDVQVHYNNKIVATQTLDNEWDCEIVPTLDNEWGDFRLPAFSGYIGAEVRRSKYIEKEVEGEGTFGFGDFFFLIAVPRDVDTDELENELRERDINQIAETIEVSGVEYSVRKYRYSNRFGLEDDPGHQGFHGLKGKVTNDFIALGQMKQEPPRNIYDNYVDEGKKYYLFTHVFCDDEKSIAHIITGETRPENAWINGEEVSEDSSVQLSGGYNRLLLKYSNICRTHFILSKSADVLDNYEAYPLSMDWYNNQNVFPYSIYTTKEPCTFMFSSPPGMNKMKFYSYSQPHVNIGGVEKTVTETGEDLLGVKQYRVDHLSLYAEEISITVESDGIHRNTDMLPEQICFECGKGKITLGDWSKTEGLYSYSGAIKYLKQFQVEDMSNRYELEMDSVESACQVYVNSKLVETKVAPPWEVNITEFIVSGENTVDIWVYNALANHYTTIPTRYRGSLKSGIMGAVKINQYAIDE